MLTLQLLRVHGDDEPLDVGEREQDDGGRHGRPLGGVPKRHDPLRVHHQRLGERILRQEIFLAFCLQGQKRSN